MDNIALPTSFIWLTSVDPPQLLKTATIENETLIFTTVNLIINED